MIVKTVKEIRRWEPRQLSAESIRKKDDEEALAKKKWLKALGMEEK